MVNRLWSYFGPPSLSSCWIAILFLHLCVLAHPAIAQRAQPDRPATECFEIILPQRYMQPASPLLFNRCTGETWMLVGNRRDASGRRGAGRHGYRWVALQVEGASAIDAERRRPLPRSQDLRSDVTDETGKKCFVFTGRRFCE
jgi:hypothetical protein